MKQINYRVYDNKNKKWFYQFNNSRTDLALSFFEKTAKASFPEIFINILDKNGVKIFENDIVK